jgi:hypothetical protein
LRRIPAIALCLITVSVFARVSAAADDGQFVRVTPPGSFVLKKITTLPLEAPRFIFHAATYPIGKGLEYLEERKVVEKVGNALSNKDKSAWGYPILGFGGGGGINIGAGYRHTNLFHRHYNLNVYYKLTLSFNQYAGFRLDAPVVMHIFDTPVEYRFESFFKRELNSDFYGMGNFSSRSNHSQYVNNDLSGNFVFQFNIFKTFDTNLAIGVDAADSRGDPNGDMPSVATTFTPDQIPGFDKWIPYFTAALAIKSDDRDNKNDPRTGGLRTLWLRRFQSLQGGDYSYNQYRLEVYQFLPLWSPGQTLVLDTKWNILDPTGTSTIPFYRLSVLDDSAPLRGFPRGRWQDHSSCLFNAEYWFPIWKMLRGMVFYDTGRVFYNLENFSFKNFKYSAGGGMDIRLFELMKLKLRVGYGGEGVNTTLGISSLL